MQPISNEEIEKILSANFPADTVEVSGDGYKYMVTIVSDKFSDLNTVKRHKLVYSLLNDAIVGGALHALTLKTYTPDEWAQQE